MAIKKSEEKPWKQAGSQLSTDRTWNSDTEKTAQGIFLKSLDIKTKEGRQVKFYVLRESNNKTVGIWGAAMLDRLMMDPAIGDEVKITFIKKSFNKETGRSLKEFSVDYRSADGTVEGTASETEEKGEMTGKDIPF